MFTMIGTILRNLTGGPVTRPYPYKVREPMAGARGHLLLDPETCSYCTLCEKRCPANAIVVSRDPKSVTLDPYRCIVCAYCVEICPKKSLSLDPRHRPAAPAAF
ncbi:MAG: 4Fe-4S binding protein [Thermodesulfobacteriota bacterium]